jgi:glycerol-3-phosphate O-acyltransferase 3/4
MNVFSIVGQKHPGWISFMQNEVLGCLGCIWFNRNEQNDRKITAERYVNLLFLRLPFIQYYVRIKSHIADPSNNRLLIFPEGTCVNNEYCVQFKKGTFEFDAAICPIAIKYK